MDEKRTLVEIGKKIRLMERRCYGFVSFSSRDCGFKKEVKQLWVSPRSS